MKLLVVTEAYRYNSSTCIRLGNVFDTFTYDYCVTLPHEVRVEDIIAADIVIFQRTLYDEAFLLAHFCLSLGKKIIYDIDDNLVLQYKDNSPRWQNLRLFLRLADLVTCSTPRLAAYLKNYNKTIWVPNTVDMSRRIKPQQIQKKIRIVISNTDYFKLTNSAANLFADIQRILVEFPQVEIAFIGVVPPAVRRLQLRAPARVCVYRQIAHYNEYLDFLRKQRFSLALVPLERTEFHSYKSNIKYLDFGLIGIPGIFSNVEPYSLLPSDTCRLVDNTAYGAWYAAIKELISDSSRRLELATKAQRFIRAQYDIVYAHRAWQKAFACSLSPDRDKKTKEVALHVLHLVQNRLERDLSYRSLVALFWKKLLKKFRH